MFLDLYNLGQLSMGDYSSIEVMRGPSTLQYGGDSHSTYGNHASSVNQKSQITDGGFVLEGGSFDNARASLSQQMMERVGDSDGRVGSLVLKTRAPNAGYQSTGGTV